MSKVFKTYIPAVSMAFTFMILFATIYNIICGNTKDDFLYFILEVGGFLLIAMVIDYLIGKINFNKYISHLCVETVLLYPFAIGVAILGKWFGVTLLNIVVYSLIYIVVMIFIHYYFYYISKQQAEEINNLLKGMSNNGGFK